MRKFGRNGILIWYSGGLMLASSTLIFKRIAETKHLAGDTITDRG